MELPRQESYAVESALEECGFDEARSRSLSRAACGSSSILRRLITRHPQTVFPEWSKPGSREELAAFALLGGWKHVDPTPNTDGLIPSKPPIDVSCIEGLMCIGQTEIERAVARWSHCDEPLFLRFHKSILIASREDAWFLLAGAISPETLRRFEELAILVLEEDDPSFELSKDERWLANVHGKVHSLSSDLRQGIVETLALMATYPIADASAFDLNFAESVRRVLDRVLPLQASWRRWATLDKYLPILAEADPELLLSRIEFDLASSSSQIPLLYQNGGDGLFSRQLHCGLLWALEVIAWDVALLSRVSTVLAKLAQIERSVDHRSGNSASNSFHEIFLTWLPHTNATVRQRILVLRGLLQENAEAGWPLIVELLAQERHSISHPTQQPRWRNWAVGWSLESISRDYFDYVRGVVELLVESAETSLARWSQIIGDVVQFGGERAFDVLAQLETVVTGSSDTIGRETLWRTIRDLTARHRAYPSANWRLPEDLLVRLDEIRDRLTPCDNVVISAWLFDDHPDLPGFDGAEDFEKYDSEVRNRRVTALRAIVDADGWNGISRLLEDAESVSTIGWIIGEQRLLELSPIDVWGMVTAESGKLNDFAANFIAGSIHTHGTQFLSTLELSKRPPNEAGKLLAWLGRSRVLWDWIDEHESRETRSAYWQQCRGFLRIDNIDDLRYAMDKLLDAKRPFTAADALHMAMSRVEVDCQLVFRVLEAGLSIEANQEPSDQLDVHATQQLIKRLQENASSNLKQLAQVEWGYLPILERTNSPVRPSTLIAEVQQSPQLFVDLLTIVYRGASDEPRVEPMNDLEVGRCKLARQLLEAIDRVPGTKNGEADSESLLRWTQQVRQLAVEVDRIDMADFTVGRLFSQFVNLDSEQPGVDCLSVCSVLEQIDSPRAIKGLLNGLINNRGIVGRGPFDGGKAERTRAEKLRARSNAVDELFPRVATAFRRLAEKYDQDAADEDVAASRRRLER